MRSNRSAFRGRGRRLLFSLVAVTSVSIAMNAWASSIDVHQSARLAGGFGVNLTYDDTSRAYVQDDSPSGETRYRVRFYLRLTDLSMGNGDEFVHFVAFDDGDTAHLHLLVRMYPGDSVPRIRLRAREDSGAWAYSSSRSLAKGWHAVEIDWAAATVGSNNGFADIWIDGIQYSGLSGLDNDQSGIDYVRWGAVGALDATTTGFLQFDEFVSLRVGTKIGLIEVFGVGLFDPSAGRFHLRHSRDKGTADVAFLYGPKPSNWIPITGDWNGNGQKTVGLYDPVASKFYLRNSNSGGIADIYYFYGPAASGWVPLAGDWNGDGTDTVGLYNPTSGTFFLANSHYPGYADVAFRYGPASSNWIPIVGDWNGNGQTTVGLYNPSTSAFYLKNSHSGGAADIYFLYGPAAGGWLPLTGDWNGDVSTGVGLFDKVGGKFYLRDALSAGTSEFHFRYGPQSTSWDMLSGFWLMP